MYIHTHTHTHTHTHGYRAHNYPCNEVICRSNELQGPSHRRELSTLHTDLYIYGADRKLNLRPIRSGAA